MEGLNVKHICTFCLVVTDKNWNISNTRLGRQQPSRLMARKWHTDLSIGHTCLQSNVLPVL